MTNLIIGADISKDHIDLYRLPNGSRRRIANDSEGFAQLLAWIGKAAVSRIVYEPTGAFHRAFEQALLAEGLPLSKVNPRRARRFGEAMGKLTKTDPLDAEMLANFAAKGDLRILPREAADLNDLKALLAARRTLIKDRTAARNRSKTLTQPLLIQQNTQRLEQIASQLDELDRAILARIKADKTLKARFDILVSVPGLSTVTAFTLLIEMPELGSLDDKSAAALSGLAPRQRQSGRWTGRATIAGGRAIVRQALFMPGLVATRFNQDLKRKYDAMIQAGKPPKLAITAIMRKLIVLANALLKHNRKWTQRTA